MIEIVMGHIYKLESVEGGPEQDLYFIHKQPKEEGSTELVTIKDGTTTEEVLRVLIARTGYLQRKTPCRENAIAITKLQEALLWLEERTRARKERNVENTSIV